MSTIHTGEDERRTGKCAIIGVVQKSKVEKAKQIARNLFVCEDMKRKGFTALVDHPLVLESLTSILDTFLPKK